MVRHTAELPQPVTLVVRSGAVGLAQQPGVSAGGEVLFTSSRGRYEAESTAGGVCFSPVEYEALAAAAAAGRAFPRDLGRWCARKRQEPAWRLSGREAWGGVSAGAGEARGSVWWAGDPRRGWPGHWLPDSEWTWGRLLAHLDAGLLAVELDGQAEAAA